MRVPGVCRSGSICGLGEVTSWRPYVVAASIYFPAGWLEETSSEAQKPPGAVSQLQTVVPAGLERS